MTQDAELAGRRVCQEHGLRFDPQLTSGCVLCRRKLLGTTATDVAPRAVPLGPIALLALIAAAAAAALFTLRAPPTTAARAAASAAAKSASSRARDARGPAPAQPEAALLAQDEPACVRAARGADAIEPSLRALLDSGADANLADAEQRTLLMRVSALGVRMAAVELLERGARVNLADERARTALMFAARENRAEVIAELGAREAALEARCMRGMTALHHAAEASPCTEGITRLLDLGTEIEASDARGATPLLVAARAGHADVVRALLERGARLDHRDHQGLGVLDYTVLPLESPSEEALEARNEVLELLIARNVDPRLGLSPSSTPIELRTELNAWLATRGLPALPALAVESEAPAPSSARALEQDGSSGHAVLHLLVRSGPASSRSAPTWLMPNASITISNAIARVPNVFQQVSVPALALRQGQQVTLSSDEAGNQPWEVDDALLFERMHGARRREAAFAGRAVYVAIDQQPLARLGTRAFKLARGAIDFTSWFGDGDGTDRIVISVLDYGGATYVSDVYLHVMGPRAHEALRGVQVEARHPR